MCSKSATETDYRRKMWDRMEGIPYPGEHSNLFGHDDALEMLAGIFQSARMHHAWLITGPRGIGKASLALAIAGHILRNPDPQLAPLSWVKPDADDAVASRIGKGGHPNVLHLSRPFDQKTKKFRSNLTVDEIRRTVSFFGTTPGEDAWRICIVDTADDMNTSAANALLKILEEPPARTIFFVLGNSPGRLLPTIRSRCRRLPLKPLNNENLQLALEALGVDTGNMDLSARQVLSRLCAGSVRKALVLLQLDGLQLYRNFNEILGKSGSPVPDWPQVHKLADELSRKNKEEQYRLLLDITRDYIGNALHLNASLASDKADNSPAKVRAAQTVLSNLARMCEVWEKTAKSASLADSYNLDRKQVILNLFGSLAQVR